jgi:hypothetical protein
MTTPVSPTLDVCIAWVERLIPPASDRSTKRAILAYLRSPNLRSQQGASEAELEALDRAALRLETARVYGLADSSQVMADAGTLRSLRLRLSGGET